MSGDSYTFEKLISDLMKYEGRREVIIMGDFNSRIPDENDCVESNDENSNDDYLPIPDDIELDTCNIERNTLDIGGISCRGRELINFCKLTGYKIVNGKLGSDKEIGNYSYHTVAGSSLVDYCLTRDHFYVSNINTLSDHTFLTLQLKIRNVNETNDGLKESANASNSTESHSSSDGNFNSLKEEYNCRYIMKNNSEELIKNCLNSNETEEELEI